jgi:hypothetical protein
MIIVMGVVIEPPGQSIEDQGLTNCRSCGILSIRGKQPKVNYVKWLVTRHMVPSFSAQRVVD